MKNQLYRLQRHTEVQQRDINLVCLYLQVTTLAGMADRSSSSKIDLAFIDARRSPTFAPNLHWPRQHEPTASQRQLWKRYVSKSENTTRFYSLNVNGFTLDRCGRGQLDDLCMRHSINGLRPITGLAFSILILKQQLFGTITPQLANPAQRILNSKNAKQLTHYLKIVYDYLLQCNAFDRAKRLSHPGNRHAYTAVCFRRV